MLSDWNTPIVLHMHQISFVSTFVFASCSVMNSTFRMYDLFFCCCCSVYLTDHYIDFMVGTHEYILFLYAFKLLYAIICKLHELPVENIDLSYDQKQSLCLWYSNGTSSDIYNFFSLLGIEPETLCTRSKTITTVPHCSS